MQPGPSRRAKEGIEAQGAPLRQLLLRVVGHRRRPQDHPLLGQGANVHIAFEKLADGALRFKAIAAPNHSPRRRSTRVDKCVPMSTRPAPGARVAASARRTPMMPRNRLRNRARRFFSVRSDSRLASNACRFEGGRRFSQTDRTQCPRRQRGEPPTQLGFKLYGAGSYVDRGHGRVGQLQKHVLWRLGNCSRLNVSVRNQLQEVVVAIA